MKKTSIATMVDARTLATLDHFCQRERRSRSQALQLSLSEYLNLHCADFVWNEPSDPRQAEMFPRETAEVRV
jgi:hypothetical protein